MKFPKNLETHKPDYIWHIEALLKRKGEKYKWLEKINDYLRGMSEEELRVRLYIYGDVEKLGKLLEILARYPKSVRGKLYEAVRWSYLRKHHGMKTVLAERIGVIVTLLPEYAKSKLNVDWAKDDYVRNTEILLKYAGEKIVDEAVRKVADKTSHRRLKVALVAAEKFGFHKMYPNIYQFLKRALELREKKLQR